MRRKLLSKSKGIEKVQKVKDELRSAVTNGYEHRAKDCGTCNTRGACCLDEHFVNVRISRLEAEVINSFLNSLPPLEQQEVRLRIGESIRKYGLSSLNASRTYACPLFDANVGCLVHHAGKPAACISHACYERREDLPPHELLDTCEMQIDGVNTQVFGRPQPWMPLPVAISKYNSALEGHLSESV